MNRLNSLLSAILLFCFISSSCEYISEDSAAEKKAKKQAKQEVETLNQTINELKKERQQIIELNKQSLKEIETYEKMRLAAERAEQIRKRADELELQALYNKKLKKIGQQQRFVWDGYIGKTYASLTTTDGKTYSKGKVVAVDVTGIALEHQNGVTRIPFALFGETMLKSNITDFEEQIKDLKRWLTRETEERKYIRNSARKKAEKEFEQR